MSAGDPFAATGPAAGATRRRFLTVTGAAAAMAVTIGVPGAGTARAATPSGCPFTLGVASGDPLPGAVVIWTRLAPEPLEPDGGMTATGVRVDWQVAEDERFRRVVRRGTAVAHRDYAHTVHVDVRGLRPFREYFYRFRVGAYESPVGRTKTAPAAGASVARLSVAYASCQAWWDGHYTAYRHLAAEEHDVVFHLGDYIYENSIPAGGGARGVDLPTWLTTEIRTLEEYRARYALGKLDVDLQAAHAAAPWIVTLDDHEVDNNWAADRSAEDGVSNEEFLIRRAAAFRAYWEHLPLRAPRTNGRRIQLYRRFTFGDLAEFSVLDTRQYRDQQVGSGGWEVPTPEVDDPARTITGDAQERWLLDGMTRSRSRWNAIAQQVLMTTLDIEPGPDRVFAMDTWAGYAASRDRVLGGLTDRGVENLVVLTGDFHRNVAADLKLDFADPDSPTVGAEFVGTSISSYGDGSDQEERGEIILAECPYVHLHNVQRGYVHCTITPEEWRTDFRVLEYVTTPGSPISTRSSMVVRDGEPGIQED